MHARNGSSEGKEYIGVSYHIGSHRHSHLSRGLELALKSVDQFDLLSILSRSFAIALLLELHHFMITLFILTLGRSKRSGSVSCFWDQACDLGGLGIKNWCMVGNCYTYFCGKT